MFDLPQRPKETVPVYTDGAFSVASMPWRFKPELPALVIIAKSTLELRPGKTAAPLVESDPLSADVYWDDDPEASLRYANDFSPLKLGVDVWVHGHAYPHGNDSSSFISLEFGSLQRRIAWIGDRYWESLGMTRPSKLKQLPLRYEYAFGGATHRANPVGRGVIEGGGARLLPNFEDPDRLIKSQRDRPPPACLGPLPQGWGDRQTYLGTYDDRWLEKYWPYFPPDFDYKYFNAAPPAQQLAEAYGNERFCLEGLHPEFARLEGRLPGRRARAFTQTTRQHGFQFNEVPLKLDTVVFDTDSMRAHLVWRGFTEVTSAIAPELALVYVTWDDVMRPADVEHCRRRFSAWISGGQEPAADAIGLRFGITDPKAEAERRKRREQLKERLPLRDEKPRASVPPAAPTRSREEVEALVASGGSLSGIDLAGCDLSRLDLRGRDLSASKLGGAALSGALLSGANLKHASLVGANCTGAALDGADLESANLAETQLSAANFERAKLSSANLSSSRGNGANFYGSDLTGANLTDSELDSVSFSGANLTAADLSACKFVSGNFTRATLVDTTAYEAQLSGASFDGANMQRFRGDQADLSGASLREVDARSASFSEAVLRAARLDGALLDEAVLNHADLTQASLMRAKLPKARLRYALLTDAHAGFANLMEANLEAADLTRADLRGSNLHGAETLEATWVDARLEQAILTQTKLTHPILKRRH
ncbi:MAG: DUF2169 domain-containing protein [Polyangiaceae bacterium]|nr:DUF2169 domain-containing protein [Polyangiaceae bacterium]MCB9608574.1 DUF2169 domain-containing protein [Polyangiaceae bacterium]